MNKSYEIEIIHQEKGLITVQASSEAEALEKVNESVQNGDCFWGEEEITEKHIISVHNN